jgi:hypothetical protein
VCVCVCVCVRVHVQVHTFVCVNSGRSKRMVLIMVGGLSKMCSKNVKTFFEILCK